MCALARPAPARLVIELAQRLAEDYEAISLTEVSRVVKRAAADTLTIDDETPTEQVEQALVEIERRARDRLAAEDDDS
jgi:DNA-binding IscR family transcriptional regulator